MMIFLINCVLIQTHLQGSEDRDREKTVAESSGTASVQQNRKEMLDLCLVDDGYDYTQHLRSIKLDSPDQVSSATKDIYLPSSNASPVFRIHINRIYLQVTIWKMKS